MSKFKYRPEELVYYFTLYMNQGISFHQLVEEYGLELSDSVFYVKLARYQARGMAGLERQIKNNSYSVSFKESIVKEYLTTNQSINQLAIKYDIPSKETVRNWISRYNEGEKLTNYFPKPEVYTMKSRPTTTEERIEIVEDCLDHELSYKETAEKYQIPYQNVYRWVQKYKKHGTKGLVDARGKRKDASIQTEAERLKEQNDILKARNKYLETENATLKKLKEIEREMRYRR